MSAGLARLGRFNAAGDAFPYALPLRVLALAAILNYQVAARLALHAYVHAHLAIPDRRFGLVVLRDAMSLYIWAASFFGRDVVWRDRTMTTDRHGTLINTGEQRAP